MVIDNRLGRDPVKPWVIIGEIRQISIGASVKDISPICLKWLSIRSESFVYTPYSTRTRCLEATYEQEEPTQKWKVYTVHTIYAEAGKYHFSTLNLKDVEA